MDLDNRLAAMFAGLAGAFVAASLTAVALALGGAPLDSRGVARLALQSLAALLAGLAAAYFLAPPLTAALDAALRGFFPAVAAHLDFSGAGLMSAVGFVIGFTFWRLAPLALDALAATTKRRGGVQ